jgi:CHAT domain-containing protein/tetratricopeptide (TPR) repeat protein
MRIDDGASGNRSGVVRRNAWAVAALLLSLSPARASATATVESPEEIEHRIVVLRRSARYAEASELSDRLLTRRREDPAVRPYLLADARRLQETMQLAATLPQRARSELAEADSLDALIESLQAKGQYDQALSALGRQIGIRRRSLGDLHDDVSASLDNFVVVQFSRGRYAEAESIGVIVLERQRALHGEDHPHVAVSLSNLASVREARGDYDEAERLFRQALAVQQRTVGDGHPDTGAFRNNLAKLLQERGDRGAAERLYREALAQQRRTLRDTDPLVVATMSNLAALLRDQGEYAAAEPLYRQILAIRRATLGQEHPDIAVCLNNLASLLRAEGNVLAADSLFREALDMRIRLLGGRHPDVAQSMNSLAVLLNQEGKAAPAESLYRAALALQRQAFGNEHPSIARTLNNLAVLLRTQARYDEAESCLREALEMRRKLYQGDHADVASSLHNLAFLLKTRGNLEAAETAYRESLAMRRRTLGPSHPDVYSSLIGLAVLQEARGRFAAAESLLLEAADVFEQARLRVGVDLTRATFAQSPYMLLAATHLQRAGAMGPEEPAAGAERAAAWQAVERSQGRVLADLLLTAASRGLSAGEARQEDSLRLALGDEQRRLSVFRKAARTDSSLAARRRVEESNTRLLEAESHWGAFEQEIARKYPVTEGQAFDLARVQAALRPEEAIIGWLEVKLEQAGLQFPSWGYVIRSSGPVEWRSLAEDVRSSGLEGAWEKVTAGLRPRPDSAWVHKVSAASDFMTEVSRRPLRTGLPESESRALYEERLSPLMGCLHGVKHLIVIPSGAMLGVPTEALAINGRGSLLGNRFAVSYIPSATIHAWLRERDEGQSEEGRSGLARGMGLGGGSSPGATCLAVGDPPFCPDQLAAMVSGAAEEALPVDQPFASVTFLPVAGMPEPLRGEDDVLVRSALAGNREARQRLERLPLTRTEVTRIAGLLDGDSRLLLGAQATEQELARMAAAGELQQYRILHFATHALVDDERPENSAMILSQVDLPDPLTAAMEGTRVYDGCVSAGEVVREWKLDADLVTLSACETALGKNVPGEGYVGLAHAFLQAGARSLLVSLWKVEDRSTAMLMERFYENLRGGYAGVRGSGPARKVGCPLPKAEALQEAKGWLRGWRDERGHQPYVQPFFWAGFVLMGETE